MSQKTRICIVGAGLAGSECALWLANRGIKVELFDTKPNGMSEAHHSTNFGEIVCSNSLKNKSPLSASGLLKQEMEMLGSSLLEIAKECEVPAGGSLAVDRELFAQKVTNALSQHKNITIHKNQEIVEPLEDAITIFAVGPLPSKGLEDNLQKLVGKKSFNFFDASAPIVDAASVDMQKAYFLGRYGKDEDYLNCPFSKEEYDRFYNELVSAKRVVLKDFEKGDVFEGCMPIEVLAARGKDAMRFGPLKPKGLPDPKTGKEPYAVVQLRKENLEAKSFGIVGFQTNLTFGEQQRVFSLIPGLERAEFLKFGVMHRNTFLNAPETFDKYFCLKQNRDVYFAGQITGVEGYVESMASGLVVAIEVAQRLEGVQFELPAETMLGALCNYVHCPNPNFQPMNANYGIMPDIATTRYGKKPSKEQKATERENLSRNAINNLKEKLKWK